uniref:Uncharacterized protein n=1 Tax=Anopheles culicifacies TaxID=139723 RepID=A0A182MRX2_9DIPT
MQHISNRTVFLTLEANYHFSACPCSNIVEPKGGENGNSLYRNCARKCEEVCPPSKAKRNEPDRTGGKATPVITGATVEGKFQRVPDEESCVTPSSKRPSRRGQLSNGDGCYQNLQTGSGNTKADDDSNQWQQQHEDGDTLNHSYGLSFPDVGSLFLGGT